MSDNPAITAGRQSLWTGCVRREIHDCERICSRCRSRGDIRMTVRTNRIINDHSIVATRITGLIQIYPARIVYKWTGDGRSCGGRRSIWAIIRSTIPSRYGRYGVTYPLTLINYSVSAEFSSTNTTSAGRNSSTRSISNRLSTASWCKYSWR